MLNFLISLNQILNAGNTITAFSLLLYALTFNLKSRVARALALLFSFVTMVYFGDVLSSTSYGTGEVELMLRLQWLGISFVPAAFLHLSDTLLEATGRPSRGRRRFAVGLSYALGAVTLLLVAFTDLIAAAPVSANTTAYLSPGAYFWVFVLFYLFDFTFAGLNFWRALKRSLSSSSRRRIGYLMVGSLGPLFGSFPFLMIGGRTLADQSLLFWSVVVVINMLASVQMVQMSYAVAYFGSTAPDRVVKSRLFQWILRGPVVASSVLAVMIVVDRIEDLLGIQGNYIVSFSMVASLMLLQFVITLIRPPVERWLFYGRDREEIIRLQLLEERLLTSGDLHQFFEAVLNAACEIVRAKNGFLAVIGSNGLELEVAIGSGDPLRDRRELPPLLITNNIKTFEHLGPIFEWDIYWLMPIRLGEDDAVVGIIGVAARSEAPDFSEEEELRLSSLMSQAKVALTNQLLQREVFESVDRLTPRVDAIQRMRASASYADADSLSQSMESFNSEEEFVALVRDALGHYWGGPRLTDSPLLELRVVREAEDGENGTSVNALRAILRRAIEQTRPEGERRFTAEWMLYNILEMKFLQGKKVREIAMRLAMSEADLYRKQRVAIEAVASLIAEMERDAVSLHMEN